MTKYLQKLVGNFICLITENAEGKYSVTFM